MAKDKTQINIYPSNDLLTKLNNYIYNMNKERPSNEKKLNRSDFIIDLIEDRLKDLVLTNTDIKLNEPFYFNMKELKENGVVKATKSNPIHEREEIYIVKSVPNNLDTFNREFRTYCSEDKPSLHRGLFIINELDLEKARTLEEGLKDTIYIFSYDSHEQTLEIAIGNDIDMYFTTEQEELKQSIIKENKDIHTLYSTFLLKNKINVVNGKEKDYTELKELSKLLDNLNAQKSYFSSFKNIKTLKKLMLEQYSELGVLDNPAVKGLLDKFKDF